MELSDDPYHLLRPARRTQWLVSVLAHHYGLDKGQENELMVLATGLDQYLQEVFHHLDWRGESSISGDEFRALCEVLGLEPGAQQEEEECEGLLERLPERLTFRQFHARLCGYFSARGGGPLLPVGQESQRVQSQIPLRSRDTPSRSLEDKELQRLEEENHALRELVEDLRAALQSSDARCLALQVGLHRNVMSQKGEDISTASNRQLSESYTVTTRCVEREGNLTQSSRDEQMEEMLKMNKDMEEEISKTQKLLVYLEECNQQLMKEQAKIRKRAECVRQMLLLCYGKVKDLESKLSKSPVLQKRMYQLEPELQQYWSKESMVGLAAQEQKILSMGPCHFTVKSEIRSPVEDADFVRRGDDQLFCSVEGRATSDEEEERWIKEPAPEEQDITTNISWCSSWCEDRRIQKLMSAIGSKGTDPRNMPFLLVEGVSRLAEQLSSKEQEIKDLEVLMDEMKVPFIEELERKDEEIELLRIDLQMLETERVRLSLIEEKLLDVLELLQQLRELEITNQELGRVLLYTLQMCREPKHGKEHLFEVLDTLHHQLSVCDIFHQQENRDNTAPSMASSLVISC